MKCNFCPFGKFQNIYLFHLCILFQMFSFAISKIKLYNLLKTFNFHALYLLSIKPVENQLSLDEKKSWKLEKWRNFDLCDPGSCPVISNYSKYYLNIWWTTENELSEGNCEHKAKCLYIAWKWWPILFQKWAARYNRL